jgi:glycosyltransferase involved in cell wall biosynthesis
VKHSIIIAYRNRPQHLLQLLSCLRMQTHPIGSWEIIVSDWGSNQKESKAVLKWFPEVTHLYHDRLDALNKSAALNTAVEKSSGEYLTFIDVDCILQPGHLKEIQTFYADGSNARKKLAIRTIYLDELLTKNALKEDDVYEYLQQKAFPYPTKWHHHAEVYGADERLLGTGLYTMSRRIFDDLGGYHEGFIGYGLEDVEMNNRYWVNYGDAVLQSRPAWHLWHPKVSDWNAGDLMEANQNLFRRIQAQGFPKLIRAKEELTSE